MMFRNKIRYLIVIAFLLRLLVAATTELGNDEVYYYTYALHLQWNYFDHPPGVALSILASTLDLFFTQEMFIRLGAIFGAAIGTALCFVIGKELRNERTGWYAAILYNTSLYSSIIAGTFILPDSPQVVCWLCGLLLMIKMVKRVSESDRVSLKHWLLFGVIAGLCIQCKIHGVFLWFGLGAYILFYSRKTFSQPGLYLSVLLTLVIISPIIFWNINNNFITFLYHGDRVEVKRFQIDFDSFLQAFFGQLLYNNPINALLAIVALFHYKSKRYLTLPLYRLLIWCGLPIIGVVLLSSLFNPVLPHWSGPGFLSLSFIAAAFLDARTDAMRSKLPAVLRAGVWLVLTTVLLASLLIHFYPGTIGSKNKEQYGSGDFTLDLIGWRSFEQQYRNWLELKDNEGYRSLKIVCNKWFPAAHLEYYVARPNHSAVVGIGRLNDLHNFAWLNKTGRDLKEGEDVLCIVPSNYPIDVAAEYQKQFLSVVPLQEFRGERGGKTTRFFIVYLLKHYQPTDEVHNIIVK